MGLQFCFGIQFPDLLFDSGDFFGADKAAGDAAADGVEQFKPVLERREVELLPLIESADAGIKQPLIADVARIYLHFFAFRGGALPTDFRLGRHAVTYTYFRGSS